MVHGARPLGPWSKAPGPLGPVVQGPWGPWGPWAQATYCQAKLHTVRQAPNRSIDLHPTSAYFAPNRFRIHAPKCFIDMHPKSSYMHPRVSAYMHLIPHAYSNSLFINYVVLNMLLLCLLYCLLDCLLVCITCWTAIPYETTHGRLFSAATAPNSGQ